MASESPKFSGGEVVSGSHVWNRDPLPPKPVVPAKEYRFRLALDGNGTVCEAFCETMEPLLNLHHQMKEFCGAEFVRLEREEVPSVAPAEIEIETPF